MEEKKLTKCEAIAAGHICVDITPAFPSEQTKPLEEILRPGKLIHMDEATVSLGGIVANTGLAMRKLGINVGLMGMVGKDAFGSIILSELKKENAAGNMIVSDKVKTSYSVVLAPKGIDRMFLHYDGANDLYDTGYMDLAAVKEAKLFHFGYPPLMRNMYLNNGEETVRLFQKVNALKTATSLDMAMVDEDSPAGKQDWNQMIRDVIPYVDFFCPSAEELCIMLDRDRYHSWLKRAAGRDITETLDLETDIRPMAEQLLQWGAKVVLIKCGAPGIYLCTADRNRLSLIGGGLGEKMADAWQDVRYFEKSYHVDKVLSGVGAGDTTIAAFLAGVLKEYPWQECLHLATATGALCTQTYDVLSGLLPLDELQKKINAGWEKRA